MRSSFPPVLQPAALARVESVVSRLCEVTAASDPNPQRTSLSARESLGFSEEGRRIVREITRGPELAQFLQELDREESEIRHGGSSE